MQEKHILLLIIITLMILPGVSALCTVTFDKSVYAPLEVITASMKCDDDNEKSKIYALTWYNQSGQVEQIDAGTTPALADTFFFDTFTIPWNLNGTGGSAVLTGTNLEGHYNFTVEEDANNLILIFLSVSEYILIGKTAGGKFLVTDSDNNTVNGAQCEMSVEDGAGIPQGVRFKDILTYGGVATAFGIVPNEGMIEGENNVMNMQCNYDSTGDHIFDKSGSVLSPFTVDYWLTVETYTDKDKYIMGEEIFICANVTSETYPESLHLHILYQLRCTAHEDNYSDMDRALIISDDNEPDRRLIGFNETRMQCKRFIIPSPKYMQGHNNTCYASTTVSVIDENDDTLMQYIPTSSDVCICSRRLDLSADWEQTSSNLYSATINLSSRKYENYNGSGIGNLSMILFRPEINIEHSEQYFYDPIRSISFLESQQIKSIKTWDCNGTSIPNIVDIDDEGNLKIKIEDVLIDRNGCYYAEMRLESITGDKMVAVILTFAMLALFFFGLAYVNTNYDVWANRIRWCGMIMAFLQLLMMIGCMYGDFAGKDITPLLLTNLWVTLLIGFGMLMISLYMKTVQLMDLTGDTEKDDNW